MNLECSNSFFYDHMDEFIEGDMKCIEIMSRFIWDRETIFKRAVYIQEGTEK